MAVGMVVLDPGKLDRSKIKLTGNRILELTENGLTTYTLFEATKD
jgi:hypothetical protein